MGKVESNRRETLMVPEEATVLVGAEDTLRTPLLASSPADIANILPEPVAPPTTEHGELPTPVVPPACVEVIAPATLPEGYEFEAETDNNERVTVVVPAGGVEAGQRILIPIQVQVVAPLVQADDRRRRSPLRDNGVPTGYWKDDICGCCNHGCCHPHLCCALCGCTPVLLAQVMTRMRLNWIGGSSTSEGQARRTFCIMTTLFVGAIGMNSLPGFLCGFGYPFVGTDDDNAFNPLGFIVPGINIHNGNNTNYGIECGDETFWILTALSRLSLLAFCVYFLIAAIRTRRAIRREFDIPSAHCCGADDCCEDVLCTYCCNKLVVMQMARHTADYDTYRASCCTDTGVTPHHPSIV